MGDDRREDRSAQLERDQAARRLFQSAPYRAVVEDMTELVVRWRPDGTRVFVNDAYCRLFEAPREALIGTSFWPLISEEDREEVRRRFARLTPDAPVVVGRHRARRPNGEVIWMEWSDRALFDAAGHIVELQSVGRDITERVRIDNELRRIEQADAVARQAAAIAHDLSGVLQVIATEIELTRRSQPGALPHSLAAVEQGIALVRQLRASGHGRVLKPEPVDLGARIQGALGVLGELAGPRAKVAVRLGTAPATLLGDPTQIDQILLNLVRNAADAMPGGGTVMIETDVLDRALLSASHRFAAEPAARISVLRVSDQGGGISQAVLPRIFDPHVTTKPHGQGLGLATVQSIVQAHHASIVVETSTRGSVFEIAFPHASRQS